jgi:micrococcal nuclease
MYEYDFKLNRVVDGDTVIGDIDLGFNIILYNQSIRLKGIDTPECRTKDLTEKEFGLFVKEYVKKKLKGSKTIRIKTYKDKNEKYGRVLGELLLKNGINLNEELIVKEYAVPYKNGPKKEIKKTHLEHWSKIKETLNG